MGRKKAEFPKGKFILKKSTTDTAYEHAIYLQYIVDGKRAIKTTSIFVPENQWNSQLQEVRSGHSLAARLNKQLQKKRAEVDAQIMDYEGRLTRDVVQQMLDGSYNTSSKSKKQDFVQYAIDYTEMRYKTEVITYSTYYNHLKYLEGFQKFLRHHTGEIFLSMAELNLAIIDAYKKWRIENGNTKETVNKTLTPLIKAAEYASNNELIKPSIAQSLAQSYLVLKDKKHNVEPEDKEIHYLTEKQMQNFVDMYYKVKYDRTREFMDMFLFSFYACGLRFSDLLTLEWKHIDWKNEKINKVLFKGNVQNDGIPLTASAIEILRTWEQKNRNKRFVFDMLPENFELSDEAELDRQRKNQNRPLKTSLGELGKKIGLTFNLSIHVARHTFAVMALNHGVLLHMISILLGHGSITTTEKVYAKFLPTRIDEEVKKKLQFSFTPSSVNLDKHMPQNDCDV